MYEIMRISHKGWFRIEHAATCEQMFASLNKWKADREYCYINIYKHGRCIYVWTRNKKSIEKMTDEEILEYYNEMYF